MQEKFKNKYTIKSARLEGYDYSQNGMYFVTICTKNREEFFGEIVDGKMVLNKIGKIAEECWKGIPDHFPFIVLDEFVVMPNHVHGIIEICKNDINMAMRRDAINRVSTGGITGKNNPMNNPYSLSKIIRWYKGRCSFEINHIGQTMNFAWQPRFYDHIIRDDESLNKIREYIKINPEMWHRDRNNAENVFM
ncbi:MAG: hypothetical protein US57_C0011G0070 [Candidatus Moranbacteria bacterium GW2011_GWC2_37_73]|nr:MAG: hypothetical protein UR95_C0006G0109 [Parcubacteria group bacterium GW2011_GWC1_36_108]KKQ00501.1 MAG: hypothetical protein US09_C0011G0059 [Candidatus Moranbacteria bacterium GW2011_GWD1_36_198]KKQ39582.1 MAG: hypothetical protein US57_C0011G0070 [Candidatus Moranbacteria bacterium GW2011_GWC2_37_73]HAR99985.1 transposase [Candidatus Moranbacteria bacterium]HBI50677.1 transposase [Candidatus Moranbacteria bacterium]